MLYSRHATVWMLSLFRASPHHTVTPTDVGNSEGGLREQYMFHIVHRFALLAPMKLTFGIGMSDQSFGNSSPTMNIDTVELSLNSFGGNRIV